jgi:cyclophilin family peptidyl-prolyl cis-trans isomerase
MTMIEPPPRGPDAYRVEVDTTAGRFEIAVTRDWSPFGADRFFALASARYYDDSRFYRVVAGRWAQFGIAGDPAVSNAWRHRTISDDRLVQSNTHGRIAFANTGPGTRSTQVYVNLGDNSARIDHEPAFAPFGEIVAGMDVVERLHAGYGETSGGGMRAGRQDAMFAEGNSWLDRHFPKLDRLIALRVVSLP